ncbi:uncharacterized protein [Apostichopus japonicus]|uniref:uncharacterized protein isoform X1 n=1 Tax=Stichopus japonicus TaxID=307972 RepID=UPI003AB2235C
MMGYGHSRFIYSVLSVTLLMILWCFSSHHSWISVATKLQKSNWRQIAPRQGTEIGSSTTSPSDRVEVSDERRTLLVQLYGPSGTPLPNFFTKGKPGGLTLRDYSNGVVVFVHHNKAAGTTIKSCMRRMQRKGIIDGPEPFLVHAPGRMELHLRARKGRKYKQMKYFMGGYSFGMCDYFTDNRKCSYFTFMRDPIERVISSYFYCHRNRGDQLCGPTRVDNFTLEEWAIYQGSYFFYQLLIQPVFCLKDWPLKKVSTSDQYILKEFQTNVTNVTNVRQCWFRQRQYFANVLTSAELTVLFDYISANLENWFAFIGMTEYFSSSLKMLTHIYNIPFEDKCDRKTNEGRYKTDLSQVNDHSSNKSELRDTLMGNPQVMKALEFDMLLYDKGMEIFQNEEKIFARRDSRN